MENVTECYLMAVGPAVVSVFLRMKKNRPAAPRPEPPEAGIYQIAGTMDGQECWIAYDHEGECSVAKGVGAYHELEGWLRNRGVRLASSRPALFIV